MNYDADFQAPGVTFLVSSGDNGAYGDYRNNNDPTVEVQDPAASPDVVAVGGTSLQNLDAAGDYPGTGANGEIGWGNGTKRPTWWWRRYQHDRAGADLAETGRPHEHRPHRRAGRPRRGLGRRPQHRFPGVLQYAGRLMAISAGPWLAAPASRRRSGPA